MQEMNEISEIKEKLGAIESLLQRLPEIQAVVFFQMLEEYENAKMQGQKCSDIWAVLPPDLR